MSFWGADHRSPTFPELFVTKPVVTQGTNRYQIKDMDSSTLIPLGQAVQKLQPVKVKHFFKFLKKAGN